ncbi:putative membrane protein [Chryseobacterium ginsenosidimutans]|uniref:DUF6629 family protein n=1 Tax=Chryseobacterium ginsenosidimutans TaxID=687846 RepID=UPI002785815F|nr:DUF6629 family protein [Chryseobacterium ginsenosidimutans]MDQ0594995.1 putative membrane protein [Chryseobacterium ginsenosidimutans]
MCFSASASFTSGVVLTVIGIACIKKTHHPSQQLFAGIPFLFGVQQIAEGVLWISLPNGSDTNIQMIFTCLFLFFAQVLWPVWVPLSILMLEKNKNKIQFQKILVVAGIIVSTYLAYCILSYSVEAKIVEHHIVYIQNYPSVFRGYGILFYALATIAPAFFSNIRGMHLFGTAILISYIVSAIFYEHYVLSVWCFFSAIISLSIYFIVDGISKRESNAFKMEMLSKIK